MAKRLGKASPSMRLNSLVMISVEWICLAMSILCIVCIAIVFIQTLVCGTWRININKDGVKGMIEFWADYKPLLLAWFGCSTLYVATVTLDRLIKNEAISSLSVLREKLNSSKKKVLHSALINCNPRFK